MYTKAVSIVDSILLFIFTLFNVYMLYNSWNCMNEGEKNLIMGLLFERLWCLGAGLIEYGEACLG